MRKINFFILFVIILSTILLLGSTDNNGMPDAGILSFVSSASAMTVAITDSSAQTTMLSTSRPIQFCASSNTAYLKFGANPTADHVAGTSCDMILVSGQCAPPAIYPYAKVAIISDAAGGIIQMRLYR
jgi:hypothetical protein